MLFESIPGERRLGYWYRELGMLRKICYRFCKLAVAETRKPDCEMV